MQTKIVPIYVSGYWHIEGNTKNSLDHYQSLIEKTFAPLAGSVLYFLCSYAPVHELIERSAIKYGIELILLPSVTSELPYFNFACEIANNASKQKLTPLTFLTAPNSGNLSNQPDKLFNHLYRDITISGSNVYAQLLAIWLSKVNLVNQIIDTYSVETDIAWVDVSFSRFFKARTHWQFWKIAGTNGKISHYSSLMYVFGRRLDISAAYLSGNPSAWQKLLPLYESVMQELDESFQAIDEEIILNEVKHRNPELFQLIGVPNRVKLNDFSAQLAHIIYRLKNKFGDYKL